MKKVRGCNGIVFMGKMEKSIKWQKLHHHPPDLKLNSSDCNLAYTTFRKCLKQDDWKLGNKFLLYMYINKFCLGLENQTTTL